MKKVDKYKLRDALEHALFLISQEESNPSFNWDDAPVICELNGYRWYLGQEAYEEMNWKDAKVWCELVGGELPPREVLLMCYINEDINPSFKTSWYWSSAEVDAATAWIQYFTNGYQGNDGKLNAIYVRAVRKVLI